VKRWIQIGCLLVFAGICIFIATQQNTVEATVEIQAEPIAIETLEERIIPEEPVVTAEIVEESIEEVEAVVEEVEELAEEADEEYANFAISNVSNYVNVRQGPSTEDKIVGKMYTDSVAQILEVTEDEEPWLKIISGSVEGYIKAEYFIYGEAALELVEQYVTTSATITASRLNVREEPSVESKRIGYLERGEKAKLIAQEEEWLQVEYSEGKLGYISAEYAVIAEEYKTAISLEEERLQKKQEEELKLRQQAKEETAPENTQTETAEVTPAQTIVISSDNATLRQQILDFAMQYLGYPYVHGGNSLETGTDCSGFTSLIYKEFGYSLSRTPGGQLASAGTGVDVSQIQIGDIVCYGKKGGKCTHVGIYAGNDQIIHASTPKGGVKMSSLYYDNILGVRNIVD